MPTSIEELERVHLRFIKVNDEAKLSEILSKILVNMLMVFLDPDLRNADLDHPKIQALEKVLNHVMMKIKNSPIVRPPYAQLLDLFNHEMYIEYENQTIKRHLSNWVLNYLFESYKTITFEEDQAIVHVILYSLDNDKLQYHDKCFLFCFLLQRLNNYSANEDRIKLSAVMKQYLTGNLKQSFLQLTLYYFMTFNEQQALEPRVVQNFQSAQTEIYNKFNTAFNSNATQFNKTMQETLMKYLSVRDLFTIEEVLPIFMVLSGSGYSKVRDDADSFVKSVLTDIDTKNTEISEKIYKLIFNETYFYRDFPNREDDQIQPFTIPLQLKLITYLQRFECAATQNPLNQKLVFILFFGNRRSDQMEKAGPEFLKFMIKYNNLENEHDAQFLKQTILKIKDDQSFSEYIKSCAYSLLADMALKKYSILDNDIDIAIQAFQELKNMISFQEMDSFQSILNYKDALNKFRDSYEKNLADPNKRTLLMAFVLNQLTKEAQGHQDLLYLLFLFLVKLDQSHNNSSVLLWSIILKDHQDIKIRKEAQYVLAKYESQQSQGQILIKFLADIEMFLQRNQMNYLQCETLEEFNKHLQFDNNYHNSLEKIDKLYDVTHFSLKYFKQEHTQLNPDQKEDVTQIIEKLLLMNLNQNFYSVKSDFSKPLQLINEYLKITQCTEVMHKIGWVLIYKLAIGSVHSSQRIFGLKIIEKILKTADEVNQKQALDIIEKDLIQEEKILTQPHEGKLNSLLQLTLIARFGKDNDKMDKMYQDLILQAIGIQALSPNVIELDKFIFHCLKKLGQTINLQERVLGQEVLGKVLDFFQTQVLKKDLDVIFRKTLLQCINGVIQNISKESQLNLTEQILEQLKEYENNEIQEYLGKFYAQSYLNVSEEKFTNFFYSQIEFVIQRKDLSLPIKRNSAIYLYKIVQYFGKSQKIVQDKFIDTQKVFLKFLFDRKPYMQDISSKALSSIYQMGSNEVKNQLVESLSQTFSGEKSTTEMQEKDENNELLLEFKDNTSSEQREKLKTYKDLCKIAVDLGHRELIYQFLEVHRHLAHYQDVKNAAKGLSGILMLDERLQKDLIKIAPKILLLSYDHNPEIQETMKELWNNLIEVENEEQIINNRWEDIYKEAFNGINSKEYRMRQSSALALSDLMANRTWEQLKPRFREVFLHSLGLLDDTSDTVKMAAYQLIKTMKRLSLKYGNIYTNGNVKELEEVLQIVIPMILDECMKSNMQMVRFFSVDLLFEIVRTSKSSVMNSKLKFNNKYEKQLVFNYNSEQKMKEILNKFLDRIIVEVIGTFSQMNKAVDTINKFEQLAIAQGFMTQKAKSKYGITEGELNDLKLKYTRDSTWGEILKICRDQMYQETFEKVLNDILNFMFKGHDQITKSMAIAFISDMILENKLDLLKPQTSKKIALKLIEVYSLSSLQNALSIKESLQTLYAQCLGLQMKILKEYPKTVNQIMEQLIQLPKELEQVICTYAFEIVKNLPEGMVKEGNGKMLKGVVPIVYINKFKVKDNNMKNLCRKIYQYLTDMIHNLIISHFNDIFGLIRDFLVSNSYDDRLAAAYALQELQNKLSEEDIQQSQVVKEVIDKLYKLIDGKYFNNKESIIESFDGLLAMSGKGYLGNKEFINSYLDVCMKQIEKFSNQQFLYKNTLIRSIYQVLKSPNAVEQDRKDQLFQLLISEIKTQLGKISQTASLIENIDSFDEKRDEEKQTVQTIVDSMPCLPYLLNNREKSEIIARLSVEYYAQTNWLIRNTMIKFSIQGLKQEMDKELKIDIVTIGEFIIHQTANNGEKYDLNLKIISDLIVLLTESYKEFIKDKAQFRLNGFKVVEMLSEKKEEEMIKNIDIIKRNLDQL